jgi:DNA-nicking Smr family endonuclease
VRRGRGLSPEERRLWEQVAASAVPLRPAEVGEAQALQPVRPRVPQPSVARVPAPEPRTTPVPGRAQMDRRRLEKLRRGRLDPEARIDLHGMTSERAHAALTAFVLTAHARDLRLLLVITGKGRASHSTPFVQRHGILRHGVPHWLGAPPLVSLILQATPAHQKHGGDGALYVYLRRKR